MNKTKKRKDASCYAYALKFPNGAIYTGSTTTKPYKRWNYGKGFRSNEAVYALIEEHGWDNVEHTVMKADGIEGARRLQTALTMLTKGGWLLNKAKAVCGFEPTPCELRMMKGIPAFYGEALDEAAWNALNGEAYSLTDSASGENPDKPVIKNIRSMKKEKMIVAKSRKINGIKVDLAIDTRYRHSDGRYPVCVRLYSERKYRWIQTGYDMTTAEFLDMNPADEKVISEVFETTCEDIRKKSEGGAQPSIESVRKPSEKGCAVNSTLAALVEERGSFMKSESTSGNYRRAAAAIRKVHKDGLPLQDVSPDTVSEVHAWMQKQKYTDATMNIYLSCIRSAINFGIYKGAVRAEQYPFKRCGYEVDKITLPKSGKRDGWYIAKEDVRRIWEWFLDRKDRYVGYWLFSYLNGGVNLADMMSLEYGTPWTDRISLVRRKTAHKTKNTITVPVTSYTMKLLETIGCEPDDGKPIFPELAYTDEKDFNNKRLLMSGYISRHIRTAARECGVKGSMSMTTARHTFATVANKTGMPSRMVEQAMGHAQSGVASHYFGGFDADEMKPWLEQLL